MIPDGQPIDPDEEIYYEGERMKIKDILSPSYRALFGYGHNPWDIEAGTIHALDNKGKPFPYTPQTCLVAGNPFHWQWINGGQNLVCPGCGIDGT